MAAVIAYIVQEFGRIMEEIKMTDNGVFEWLMEKGPRHWARSYFRTMVDCDLIVNNLCESFNGTKTILIARTKPILSMLERIRMYMLKRFSRHRTLSSEIGPRVSALLEAAKANSRKFIAHYSGGLKCQVQGMYGGMHSVDLQNRRCSCKKWDLSGIPCRHAICCIWRRQEDSLEYVSKWYKTGMHIRYFPLGHKSNGQRVQTDLSNNQQTKLCRDDLSEFVGLSMTKFVHQIPVQCGA